MVCAVFHVPTRNPSAAWAGTDHAVRVKTTAKDHRKFFNENFPVNENIPLNKNILLNENFLLANKTSRGLAPNPTQGTSPLGTPESKKARWLPQHQPQHQGKQFDGRSGFQPISRCMALQRSTVLPLPLPVSASPSLGLDPTSGKKRFAPAAREMALGSCVQCALDTVPITNHENSVRIC